MTTTMNMEGEALKWLLRMDGVGQLNSWSDFMGDISKLFGEGSYVVPRGAFVN